jgi:uncharacterized protein (TIGR00725 family)
MGPGEGARLQDCEHARILGRLLAQRGWVTLCGGRFAGVMAAVAAGARSGGGLVVGILPGTTTSGAAPELDLALATGLGHARNAVNALGSDVLIACGMGLGTAAEVALALKNRKPVVLLGASEAARTFFREINGREVPSVATPEAAVEWVARKLGDRA